MKKIIMIVSVFAFSFAITASVAFAGRDHRGHGDSGLEIDSSNSATITNDIDTNANTGNNDANRNRGVGRITTGDAYAEAVVTTKANRNITEVDCGCIGGRKGADIDSSNRATVRNDIDTNANTGNNDANSNGGTGHHGPRVQFLNGGGHQNSSGRGVISTGVATAISDVMTVVNSNVTRLGSN